MNLQLFLAIVIPGIYFLGRGFPGAGILCLFLQLTGIGWPFCSFWAVTDYNQLEVDRKLRDMAYYSAQHRENL
jgi:hypothetical protein